MAACEYCGQSKDTEGVHKPDETRSHCEPCTTLANDHSIRVSPLERDDLELLLAWRSHPTVYQYSRQQDGPLDWNEHIAWFKSRDPDRHDFVVHYEGRRVGVVSLDGDDEVSIYLGDFSAHGHGVATRTLKWLTERFENREPLTAEINDENDASKRLFSGCGFEKAGRDGEWLQYVYSS